MAGTWFRAAVKACFYLLLHDSNKGSGTCHLHGLSPVRHAIMMRHRSFYFGGWIGWDHTDSKSVQSGATPEPPAT